MGELESVFRKEFEWMDGKGKITRGEQLEGLPFVALDFPQLKKEENICAFRTLFWWGYYFSVNILLSGIELEKRKEGIANKIKEQQALPIYISNYDSLWEHNLDSPHFVSATDFDIKELEKRKTLKISAKIDLNNYIELEKTALTFYKSFI